MAEISFLSSSEIICSRSLAGIWVIDAMLFDRCPNLRISVTQKDLKILNTVLGEAVTWCSDKVYSSSQLLIDTRREGVTCAEVQLEK
jgi:hypothetical protein